MLLAGVDEAGRGPALGPLVLAVVVATKEQEEKLTELGVRDSKEVPPKKRKKLEKQIRDCVEEYCVRIVEPSELNKLMLRKSLNEIEAMRIGELVNSLTSKPELLFVDSPDLIESNFSRRIKRYCKKQLSIKSEHFADQNYPLVSAASVLAKVARDKSIEKLKKEFGELGSGYPHDPNTIKFIKEWVDKNSCLPPFARKMWATNRRELDKKFQRKLGEW